MMTTRHIERLWNTKSYNKLSQELLATRQEAAFGVEGADRPCFLAALAMIRMDELAQSHLPLFSALLGTVLNTQERDGGWGDAAATALCVRALLLGHGQGEAIDAGLKYLAMMQKEEGVWPMGPMRRMPADPAASLFTLYQLGENARFRDALRFDDALAWFDRSLATLSQEMQALYQWTSLRWRVGRSIDAQSVLFAA